jgi:hypothetical protein
MSKADGPELSEHGRAAAAQRRERLAAALRDNLKKRKEQARARRAGEEAADGDGDRKERGTSTR